jgi:hypothetical protein
MMARVANREMGGMTSPRRVSSASLMGTRGGLLTRQGGSIFVTRYVPVVISFNGEGISMPKGAGA